MSLSLPTFHHTREQNYLVANLRKLMEKAGLNEAGLARKTQIPQATVHKILSGQTEDPRASTLMILAKYFDVSIDALLNGVTQTQKEFFGVSSQSMPIISWSACIEAISFISELTSVNWNEWVVSESFSNHGYALRSNPSLSPRFPKGTILFIDPNLTPTDGDYVVVHFFGTNDATLRELSVDGPSCLLLPVNSNRGSSLADENVKILGVLVKTSFQY